MSPFVAQHAGLIELTLVEGIVLAIAFRELWSVRGSQRHKADRPPDEDSVRPPDEDSDRPPDEDSARPPEDRSDKPPVAAADPSSVAAREAAHRAGVDEGNRSP